jgi:hypothetical protein
VSSCLFLVAIPYHCFNDPSSVRIYVTRAQQSMNRFISTRGEKRVYTFEEALFAGYADDGGMLLPQSLPRIDAPTLQR